MMLARPCRHALSIASRWSRLLSTTPSLAISSTNPTFQADETDVPQALSEPELASSIIHGRSAYPALIHPRTHSIPVALLHFRSYHPSLLDFFLHFTSHTASSLAIPISRPIHLPTQRSLWTVPKSPFVHKKSQENFERKTHKRLIKVWDTHDDVLDMYVKYLERHAMAGVGMRVVRWQRVPVGVGKLAYDDVLGSMRLDREMIGMSPEELKTSKEKMHELGKKIIREETAAAVAAGHPDVTPTAPPTKPN